MSGRARLAWNLRHLRTARQLSQEALAVDSAVAAPYISGIERGIVNPTIDVLDKLASALDVEIDALLVAVDGRLKSPRSLQAGRKPTKPEGRSSRKSK